MSKKTPTLRRAETASTWRTKKVRGVASWLLFGLLLAGVVAAVVYVQGLGSEAPQEAETVGDQVRPFELPDVVSGRNVSLADYLGKQEIVIVSYMGWFCLGCEELLVELQGRKADFKERGAALLVLGSQPEPRSIAEEHARLAGITYPLLHDANTRVTKELGLWSTHMQMPWMGYLIIDKSGRVVASDLQLAEAKGAAPRNVDAILHALDRLQTAAVPAE